MAVKKSFKSGLRKSAPRTISSGTKKKSTSSFRPRSATPSTRKSYRAPTKAPARASTSAGPARSNPVPISEAPRPSTKKNFSNPLKSRPSAQKTPTRVAAALPSATQKAGGTSQQAVQRLATAAASPKNNTTALRNAAMNTLAARLATPVTSTDSNSTPGYGAESGGGIRTPVAAPTPEVVAPAAPSVVAPTPQVNAPGSGAGAGGGSFKSLSSGRGGPAGYLNRMRNQRGPLNNLSMTPELLRRLAAQRIQR